MITKQNERVRTNLKTIISLHTKFIYKQNEKSQNKQEKKTSKDDKNHFSCYTFNMYSLHAEKRNLLFRMEIKKTSSLKRNRKSCKVQIKNLLIKFLALQMPPRHGQLLQCDSKSSQPCKNKILLRHFCGQKKAA